MNVEILPNQIFEICTAKPLAQLAFDYDELEPTVAHDARALAEQVHAFHRRTAAGMLDIGRDLAAMKERLGHGNFGIWLKAEFGDQERSMQRYMAAALAFPGESDTLSVLPISTVHVLAAKTTPEPIRANIVERLKRGETLQPKIIGDMVSYARWMIKDAEREASIAEKQRKDRARRAAREKIDHERRRADYAAEREREEAARQAAGALIVETMPPEAVDRLLELLAAGFYGSLTHEIHRARLVDFEQVVRDGVEEALSDQETTP